MFLLTSLFFLSIVKPIFSFFTFFREKNDEEKKKEKERKNGKGWGENPPRARMWEQYHRDELKRFIITHCVQYYRRKPIRPSD